MPQVRGRRQHHQTCPRNRRQHPRRRRFLVPAAEQPEHRQRMLRLHTVRVADDHHRLRGDRPYLCVADLLVRDGEHGHLLDMAGERSGFRRVLVERLLDRCAGKGCRLEIPDGFEHRRVPAVLPIGGRQRHQRADEFRVPERELQRHRTAVRVSRHMCVLHARRPRQCRGVVGAILVRDRARGVRGTPVSLLIEDDHRARRRKRARPRRHRLGAQECAGDEQQRRRGGPRGL